MSHDIKLAPATFAAVLNGQRTIDVINRNYGLGDLLTLREFNTNTYLPAR